MSDVDFQSGGRIFEWDTEKNRLNKIKHGINFKTAAKVFNDDNRIERPDFEHSQDEERWQVIGLVDDVIFVVYTERGIKTRLISARLATDNERSEYYGDGDIYFA